MKDSGRILVVLDQSTEMAAVVPHFSDLPGGWKTHFSQSPTDALCQMDQVTFDLVFADLAGGPFASAQFLHEVWARHPATIRFMLGDRMEPDLMVTCALGPHQFLQKPLDVRSVQNALERATLVSELLASKSTQTLVSRIRTFPARPSVYAQVLKEVHSPNASTQSVGEIVARDLAISTKLLQITNSAFFGFQQHVSSTGDAVLLLGMHTTASLVLGIEAFAKLDNVKLLYFSSDRVWKHSQAVATSARNICDLMTNDVNMAHEAYTAGLLHDLGKLALAVNLEEQYCDAIKSAEKKNLPLFEIERQQFGATHAEAGAYLLSLWGLPASVIQAVALHHAPAKSMAPKFNAVTAVHLANTLEYAEIAARAGLPHFSLDLDYPAELAITANLKELRQVVRGTERLPEDRTRFISRAPINQPSEARSTAQPHSDASPDGWWARFRSLLTA